MGVLIVRKALLTTNKVAGCPGLKIPAEVVFYRGRDGSAGPDHVVYKVTSSSGEIETFDVTITLKPGRANAKPAKEPEGQFAVSVSNEISGPARP